MKKIFAMFAIALMVATMMVSCNEKKADNGAKEINDSLSMLFGKQTGAQMLSQLGQDSAAKAKLDVDQFIKGMQMVLMKDSTKANESFLQGAMLAMQMRQGIQGMKEQQGVEIDPKVFLAEFKKAFKGKELTPEEIQAMTEQIEPLMNRALEVKMANDPTAQKNKAEGAKYIAEQKKDKAYKATKSGILYKVEREGNGENFKVGQTVDVIYTGKLIDGTEFDSSKGKATPFPVNDGALIKGFVEILQLMKPGAKYHIVIPAELAYGPRGQQPKIGPNATLVFDVETVGIHKTEAPAANGAAPQAVPVQPKKK